MKFDTLCESLTQIKTTKIMRYPKQISISESFLKALEGEIRKHLIIDESKEIPIKNFNEKFLKALTFHISDLQEKCTRPTSKSKVKLSEHCGHCHKNKKKKKKVIVQSQAGAGTGYGTSKVTAQ